jgi:hypothetical protein
VKTWVVRVPGDATRAWFGNAESATEAVQYARARGGVIAERYVVFDWDLDGVEVTVEYKAESEVD